MKPIIAVLADVEDDKSISLVYTYTPALEALGSLPVVIPYTESEELILSYLELCDGVLFTGGDDICPSHYGKEPSRHLGKLQPNRDKLELAFFKAAAEADKPILAICRGAQLVNVALGGTLIQDIPTEAPSGILHRQSEGKFDYSHEVNVLADTPLAELMGAERIRVNSFHHQAIDALAPSLSVSALADDGIIEAAYMRDKYYVRIYQWHPERLWDKDSYNKAVFTDFIRACKERTRTK